VSENKYGSAARAAIRREVFAPAEPVCYLCGKKIDKNLPAFLPGSPELEDVKAVANGGNPNDKDNGMPSHRACNRRKGTLPVEVAIRNERARRGTSRVW
jgi:hypothetical protein